MQRYSVFISVCLLGWIGSCTSLRADEPKNAQESEEEVIATLRKSAEKAEIQAIGIGGPHTHRFRWEEVTDWPEFVKLLRKKEGPAGRIWELLPKDLQNQLADDKLVAQIGVIITPVAEVRSLRSDIGYRVSRMLEKPDLYTKEAFKDISLDKNLKEAIALGEKRTYLQTLCLNRQLLAIAFPNIIKPTPDNYHKVRVVVKAGKPVILVLTSYTACQWQIEVEKGGEVAGIILGGTEPQEVAGVKAPVLYRAGRAPNWKERANEEVIWTCRDASDDKSFDQLKAGVKKITGKTLTEFQGDQGTPKEQFVVTPNAK